jgi:hypothetical protein
MSKDKSVDPQVAEAVTDELREVVLAKATNGSIPCAALRRLAEDNDVPYKVAGAAADMSGIKVRSCDLGCF